MSSGPTRSPNGGRPGTPTQASRPPESPEREARIDESLEETFPASDPPAWASVREEEGTKTEPSGDDVTIRHDPGNGRFEAQVDGRVAELTYSRSGNTLVIDHTGVPPSGRRRGIGGRLAKAALEYARAGNLTVDPVCPFVSAYIRAHPEYQSLVVKP